jgi:hypothetical protein
MMGKGRLTRSEIAPTTVEMEFKEKGEEDLCYIKARKYEGVLSLSAQGFSRVRERRASK